jgi:YD repeat-containing protein
MNKPVEPFSDHIIGPIYKRGLLKRKRIYNSSNKKLYEEELEHSFIDGAIIYANRVHKIWSGPTSYPFYYFSAYEIPTGKSFQSSKLLISFDENGENPVESLENYTYYEDRELIKNIEKINSTGITTSTSYTYPFCYPDVTFDESNGNRTDIHQALVDMSNSNMHNYPVETLISLNNSWKDGTLIVYKQEGTNINPKEHYNYKVGTPQMGFVAFDGRQVNDLFFLKTTEFEKFDQKGRLVQYRKNGNISISFIRDMFNNFSAVVENAAIDQVAYTGFEQTITANGTSSQIIGNWEIVGGPAWYRALQSKAGKYALGTSSGGSLIKTANLVEPGRYMVTLWATTSSITFQPTPMWSNITYSGNTWYFHEAEIELTNPDEIEVLISGIIDELRLHPKESNITTYSYDSFGNVLTINDNNNIMQHYDYDGLGRLIRVRDNDYNIIQQYEYNYATENE